MTDQEYILKIAKDIVKEKPLKYRIKKRGDDIYIERNEGFMKWNRLERYCTMESAKKGLKNLKKRNADRKIKAQNLLNNIKNG